LASTFGPTEKRLTAARAAVLLLLNEFGREELKSVKNWRDCVRHIGAGTKELAQIQAATLEVVVGECKCSTKDDAVAAVKRVLHVLGELVEGEEKSRVLPTGWFEESEIATQPPSSSPTMNCLTVAAGEIHVPIHVATIAAVKGETHLATLILESCFNKKHDLKSILPFLCGDSDASTVSDDATRSQLMNIFVAASRPRKHLAFAMHSNRIDDASRAKLQARGWNVIDWTTSEIPSEALVY
jgi:hypothetical protein